MAAWGLMLVSTTATASPTLGTISLARMSWSITSFSCLVVTVRLSLAGT